jgi:hypothetical protein
MRRYVLLRSVLRRYVLLRKIAAYQQQYADNQNISFLPAIVSTSTRMHGEFLRLLFLQAHRETEAHFTAAGMSSQTNNSEALRFKRAAFYNGLKSKVGLAAAKAAALRVNLNVQGCGIVATPMHAPSRTPLLPPLLLSHNLPTPRVHWCVMSRLIHTGLGSSSLIAHVLHSPPLPTRTAL